MKKSVITIGLTSWLYLCELLRFLLYHVAVVVKAVQLLLEK